MQNMAEALALIPFLVFFLMLGLRQTLIRSAALCLTTTLAIAGLYWDLSVSLTFAALIKASLITVDLSLIVFGALAFIRYMKVSKRLALLQGALEGITPIRSLQVLLLVWFLGALLEGVAGFGTPGAVLAPLLVTLGLSPVRSMMICLTANTIPVLFGAAGTPVRVGLASVSIERVPETAAFLGAVGSILVCLLLVRFSGDNSSRDECRPWLWAVWAAFSFSVPFFWVSQFSYELSTILGAVIGFVIFSTSIQGVARCRGRQKELSYSRLLKGFLPYGLLIFILILSKVLLGPVGIKIAVGSEFSHRLSLFHPGLVFLGTLLVLSRIDRVSWRSNFVGTGPILLRVSSAFLLLGAITYVLIASGRGQSSGMLEALAEAIPPSSLRWVSAPIGAFGSFLTGSATASNLLFASLQSDAAYASAYPVHLILALQLTGAGLGNMVSLPNLVAVQGALGLSGKERDLLKSLVPWCFLLLLLVGLAGFLLSSQAP
jgi:lactate permease